MTDEAPVPVIERRGANLHIRAGARFRLDAHMDIAPIRLLAIGALVASTLLSVAAVIRAAMRRRDRGPR